MIIIIIFIAFVITTNHNHHSIMHRRNHHIPQHRRRCSIVDLRVTLKPMTPNENVTSKCSSRVDSRSLKGFSLFLCQSCIRCVRDARVSCVKGEKTKDLASLSVPTWGRACIQSDSDLPRFIFFSFDLCVKLFFFVEYENNCYILYV